MPSSDTQWKTGQSGNPKGAPKKSRRFTAILERSLSKTVVLRDGSKVPGKRYIADIIRQALTSNRIILADGSECILKSDEIIDLLRWVYKHLDGDVKQEMDVTSAGEALVVKIVKGVSFDDI